MRINKTLLAADLGLNEILANKTKKELEQLVEDFFELIATHIAESNEVSIPGFGKFERYEKQDGSHKAKFTPYKELKEKVRGCK